MATVQTQFDCGHQVSVDVSIDDDVIVPETVRGLGRCYACQGADNLVSISGVAPQPGGKQLVLDSIMLMPVEG